MDLVFLLLFCYQILILSLAIISLYSFGFGKLDGGLEQPIANWAKLGGTQWRASV